LRSVALLGLKKGKGVSWKNSRTEGEKPHDFHQKDPGTRFLSSVNSGQEKSTILHKEGLRPSKTNTSLSGEVNR